MNLFNESNPLRENKLINLIGSVVEDKPMPMSDPISRKSPNKQENNVLLDFLAPEATNNSMVQSSSAPNLADIGGRINDTNSSSF